VNVTNCPTATRCGVTALAIRRSACATVVVIVPLLFAGFGSYWSVLAMLAVLVCGTGLLTRA
jgi:hypothetical protein